MPAPFVRLRLAAILVTAAACGAGGDGTSTPTPAIDPSLPLASLDASQKAELCDWEAAKLGGYGTTTSCGGASGVMVPVSQSDCVAGFNFSQNTCQATVSDEFNCVDVVSQSPCQATLDNAPECQVVISCK